MNQVSNVKKNSGKGLAEVLEKMKPQYALVLPDTLTPERLTRIALTEARRNPELATCDPTSFAGALMVCAQLGLEPASGLDKVYLIPRNNRKNQTKEVQVMLGYKGMIELARRSGDVVSLEAFCIYENEYFEVEYGSKKFLRHKPLIFGKGKLIGVYAIAELTRGAHQFVVMSLEEVDKIKERGGDKSFSPWKTDYEEMAKKSVIKKLFKYLPASTQVKEARNNRQKFNKELKESLEQEEIDIDEETGEIMGDEFLDTIDLDENSYNEVTDDK